MIRNRCNEEPEKEFVFLLNVVSPIVVVVTINIWNSAHYCILVTTGHYWSLLVTTGHFYWSLLVPTGHYWSLLVTTGHYWSLPPTTAHYLVRHVNKVSVLPLERDKGEPRGPTTPSMHGVLWCWRLVLGREGHDRSFGVFICRQDRRQLLVAGRQTP